METGKSHRNIQILIVIPILIGLGLITVALVGDYIGIGGLAGFGRKQLKLLLVGVAVLAGGVFLITPIGMRVIQKVFGLITYEVEPLEAYQHLVITLWFGYLTGVIEAFVLAIRQNLLHQFIFLSRDVYWMTVLATLVVFTILGLFIFLVASLALDYVPMSLTVFFSAFLGLMILMLLFPRINQIASFLLSIGVAMQVVRIVIRRIDHFYAFVTHSFAWICILSALLVISMEVLNL